MLVFIHVLIWVVRFSSVYGLSKYHRISEHIAMRMAVQGGAHDAYSLCDDLTAQACKSPWTPKASIS
eukprot:5910697-Amphidinium_carterae.1